MERENLRKSIVYHAGMPRSGSTFLYSTFSQHPDVQLPPVKEVNFFNLHYNKGEDWYEKLFNELKENQISFDFSPTYFFDLDSIERILDFNPRAKVILGVRKPSDYVLSYYKQLLPTSVEKNLSFADFLKKGLSTIQTGVSHQKIQAPTPENIIHSIETYKKEFKDNLLIYSYEALDKTPLLLLSAIEGFIGASHYFKESNFKNQKINTSERFVFRPFIYLRSRPIVYKTALKLIPHKLLSKVFVLLSKLALLVPQRKKKNPKEEENKSLAQNIYREADHYYEDLFKNKSLIQLGTGTSYPTKH